MGKDECDGIVFDDGYLYFTHGNTRGGGGGYTQNPRDVIAAKLAFESLQRCDGSVVYEDGGYWMKGPFGTQYAANPIYMAKLLGFLPKKD